VYTKRPSLWGTKGREYCSPRFKHGWQLRLLNLLYIASAVVVIVRMGVAWTVDLLVVMNLLLRESQG